MVKLVVFSQLSRLEVRETARVRHVALELVDPGSLIKGASSWSTNASKVWTNLKTHNLNQFEIFQKFSNDRALDEFFFSESLTCNFITKHRQENLKVPPVTDFGAGCTKQIEASSLGCKMLGTCCPEPLGLVWASPCAVILQPGVAIKRPCPYRQCLNNASLQGCPNLPLSI